jgi:hypothetical protein
MKSWTLIVAFVLAIVAIGVPGFAQQNANGSGTTVAKAVAPPTPTGGMVVQAKPAARTINPDEAYKANCSRCHGAPRKFSDRAMATIMRHMQVRANLTAEETKAILQYLTE